VVEPVAEPPLRAGERPVVRVDARDGVSEHGRFPAREPESSRAVEEPEHLGGEIGAALYVGIARNRVARVTSPSAEPNARAIRLVHLLAARPVARRGEPEVRQRAPDRGRLRVLETGHGVDLAVVDAFRSPPRGGGLPLDGSAEYLGAERYVRVGVPNEVRDDPPGGVAVVEQPNAFGDGRILAVAEPEV